MAVFAVLLPFVLLGTVLALGRYEELMLAEREPDAVEPVVLRH
ncbi:hypothetical protein ABT382_21495 [Streptomyces pharetrae]